LVTFSVAFPNLWVMHDELAAPPEDKLVDRGPNQPHGRRANDAYAQ
jgi:hypothetical protein